MNLIVVLEHRFASTPDGAVWTVSQFPHSFWMRYLEVFDQVRVVARVKKVPSVSSMWKRADGEGVSFAAVPHYIGPWQYLLKAQQVKHAVRNAVGVNNAVILRVSSQIAQCLEPILLQNSYPYGVEVVADPYEIFAPGSIKNPLRPFFRWLFPRRLRRICAQASVASYVTEQALQRRYPPAPNAFATYYSDVELPDIAFVSAPRPPRHTKLHSDTKLIPDVAGGNGDKVTPFNGTWYQEPGRFNLICVGTLAQLYKGQDILIDAVNLCIKEGLDLKLILVGDGKHRGELEQQSANLGLEERVCFLGQLSAGDAVRTQLDRADLFVLPSRTEGLPRALIEAMARGLPCIGSQVGGIPELLTPEDLVAPDNLAALAGKIREVVTDPERMARMSARNLEKARDYKEEILRERRNTFYCYLRERTEAWLKTSKL